MSLFPDEFCLALLQNSVRNQTFSDPENHVLDYLQIRKVGRVCNVDLLNMHDRVSN